MFNKAPVKITRIHSEKVLVEFSGQTFVKGFASGAGCNCLIDTLITCLNVNIGLHCVAKKEWIRQELRKQYRSGENEVTADNYLDLRNHWRSIIDLIGISARANQCDPRRDIMAANFRITSVSQQHRVVAEEDGDGFYQLFTLNEGNLHFVPLLKYRGHQM